jgi:hypothetical protein
MSEDPEQDRLIDAVIGPTSEAYYSDRVRASGAARVRAQAAQSTITVFLGGLVGAFTITALTDRPILLRIAGFVAVVLWICAGLLYLRAVALPVETTVQTTHVKDRLALIDHVLKKADGEARQIDRRQRAANGVVMAAAVTTLTAFGFFLFGGGDSGQAGSVMVSPAYVTTLRSLCPRLTGVLTGSVRTDSLASQFVQIKMSDPSCATKQITLQIPRADVTAVLLEGE